MNTRPATSMYPVIPRRLMVPAGIALAAVRGFRESISASMRRFAAIPNVRIPTIATITQKNPTQSGVPLAEMNAASTANGSANTECSNLIASRNTMRRCSGVAGLSEAVFVTTNQSRLPKELKQTLVKKQAVFSVLARNRVDSGHRKTASERQPH